MNSKQQESQLPQGQQPTIQEAVPAILEGNDSIDWKPTREAQGAKALPEESNEDSSQVKANPRIGRNVVNVSFNQLMFESLNSHPSIRIELEKLQQARADFWTSSLKPNPELDSAMTLMPLTRPFTEDRQGGPPQFDIAMAYPIDWFLFGKRAAAMQAAHLSVHVSQSEFENMLRLRVAATALAYYDVLEAKALRELAETNVATFRRVLTLTEQAIANGGRPMIEGKRISLDLLNAEQELTSATATEKSAIAKLRVFLGNSFDGSSIEVEGNLEVGAFLDNLTLDEAVSIARQTRPDLIALRWQVAQADAVVDRDIRSAKPTITPSLGYTRQFQEKAIGFPDANSWGAGVNMTLPLYDRNQGNIAKAASVRRAASSQLALAYLELEAEIARVIAELEAAKSNAQSIESEQQKLAKEVLESIEIAYNNGGRPLIDLLDAQRNFNEINARAIHAKAAYWRAHYQYLAAIWQNNPIPIATQP